MKNLLAIFILISLASCNSQRKYSDFDISYSKSGGFAPIYENLLIKDNSVHYSLEGQGKKFKKDFRISSEERKNLENVLSANKFKTIREDYKKVYDYISTSIIIKKGPNSGSKTDSGFIMEGDQDRWNNITSAFRNLIKSKVGNAELK